MAYRDNGKKYLELAFNLSDRLSDRESYLIQGDFYNSSARDNEKAIEAYDKLRDLYPDDVEGNENLGELYRTLEQWDKSIERYRVNVENQEESVFSYTGLAMVYMAKGHYDQAQKILESYLAAFSDNALVHQELGFLYFCQDKLDLALIEYDKALLIEPNIFQLFYRKGNVYHVKGEMENAKAEFTKILQMEEQPAHFWGRD